MFFCCSLLRSLYHRPLCLVADAVSLRGQGRSDRKTAAGEQLKVRWQLKSPAQSCLAQLPLGVASSAGEIHGETGTGIHTTSCWLLPAPRRQVSGDLDSLTDDLAHVVAGLPRPPVLVAHSFGALLAEKYMTGVWLGGVGRVRSCCLAHTLLVCGWPRST